MSDSQRQISKKKRRIGKREGLLGLAVGDVAKLVSVRTVVDHLCEVAAGLEQVGRRVEFNL